MKIENGAMNTFTVGDTQFKKTATHTGPDAMPSGKPVADAFRVELSPAAGQMNKLQDPDEISRAKVAAIRDQLASGTYNISGKDVANKILGVLKK